MASKFFAKKTLKTAVTTPVSEKAVLPERDEEPVYGDVPTPTNPAGRKDNDCETLSKTYACKGTSASTFPGPNNYINFRSAITKQFTVYNVSDEEITRIFVGVANPERLGITLPTQPKNLQASGISISALLHLKLCKDKSILKIRPGPDLVSTGHPCYALEITNPVDQSKSWVPDTLVTSQEDVETGADNKQEAEAVREVLQRLGVCYTIEDVLYVASPNASGTLAKAQTLLWNNVTILADYFDESFPQIIQVYPEELDIALRILNPDNYDIVRDELQKGCYSCEDIDLKPNLGDCKYPVPNCGFRFPCAVTKCKDCDEDKREKPCIFDSEEDESEDDKPCKRTKKCKKPKKHCSRSNCKNLSCSCNKKRHEDDDDDADEDDEELVIPRRR